MLNKPSSLESCSDRASFDGGKKAVTLFVFEHSQAWSSPLTRLTDSGVSFVLRLRLNALGGQKMSGSCDGGKTAKMQQF